MHHRVMSTLQDNNYPSTQMMDKQANESALDYKQNIDTLRSPVWRQSSTFTNHYQKHSHKEK